MSTLATPGKAGDDFPIVAVTGTMPLGGSSTFLINLAIGMRSLGKKLVLIVMGTNNPYRQEFLATGAILHEISRNDSIYEDRIAEVYRLTASYQPSMVLSCMSGESFEVQRYVPKGVLRMGMVQSDDPGVYRMVAVYARWLDGMIGVSDLIRRRLAAMPQFEGKQTVYIPYGIAFRDEMRPRPLRSVNTPLRVIYAGRLVEEQKRISRIAKVIKTLTDGSGSFEFTIAGGGPQEQWMKQEVGGLPGVRFLGEIDNGTVMRCFAEQDVFLLLSDYEGLPLALLESMGMGCVPVVSDLESGIRDVVTEECGMKVAGGDPDGAVKSLIELLLDRSLLKRMSDQSRGEARARYSAGSMAQRYLSTSRENPLVTVCPTWKAHLTRIAVPLETAPTWFYAHPVRTLRRFRRWFLNLRVS